MQGSFFSPRNTNSVLLKNLQTIELAEKIVADVVSFSQERWENIDLGVDEMYKKKSDRLQLEMEDFLLPFGGHLAGKNRRVKLAQLMPWDMVEEIYARNFKNERPDGRPPIPARIAFGALYMRASECFTDE